MEKDDELKLSVGTSYDFGAWMLEPKIGRWLSMDPLSSKYPFISPYTFVANKPIVTIDPDGKEIRIYYEKKTINEETGETVSSNEYYVYGSGLEVPNDEFVLNTVASLDYLVNNELGNIKGTEINVVDALMNNDQLHANIHETNKKVNSALKDDIDFNPSLGLMNGSSKLPPAILLLHELGHVWGFNFDFKRFKQRQKATLPAPLEPRETIRSNWDGEGYDNEDERFVIDRIETPAAIKMGFIPRKDHDGEKYPTDCPESICTPLEVSQMHTIENLPKDFFKKISKINL